MNRYFLVSILCFGLCIVISFLSLVFVYGAHVFDGIEGAHPMQLTFRGLPVWLFLMSLVTLGIFFLIFGFKQKLFLQSQKQK